MKINRVITAVGDPQIAEELKKHDVNVVTNDIQYREGILEYLAKSKDINYIIFDEKIPGNISVDQLIYYIKKYNKNIKVIVKSEKENLRAYRVLDKINIEEIIGLIKKDNIFTKTYLPINDFFNQRTKEAEIITVLGANGIGKSVFSIAFASYEKNKKVLVIDFDIINNDLHNLLNVEEYSKKIKKQFNNDILLQTKNIHEFIIHTKFNIDLLSGINLIFNSKKHPNINKIKSIIFELKKDYDLIIIDTAPMHLLEYTKELINISNNTILISGANKIEIKKTINLIDLYKKECYLNNNQINIIFNKWTRNSLSDDILKNIFKKYKILGKIKMSNYYDIAVNKNIPKIPEINKEIKIIKEKYNKKFKKKKQKNNKK